MKPTNLKLASSLTGSVVRLRRLKAEPALNGRRQGRTAARSSTFWLNVTLYILWVRVACV